MLQAIFRFEISEKATGQFQHCSHVPTPGYVDAEVRKLIELH